MKRVCALVLLLLLIAPTARAQNAPEAAPPVPANVRFDVLITDDSGNGRLLTKTVTLNLIASFNGGNESGIGQIRSSARPAGAPLIQSDDGKSIVPLDLNLNVDINRPRLMLGNKIRVPIVVEYRPYSAEPKAVTATVRASVDMLMDHGKKTVISQTSDPVTDRKIVIEVTPTIQR
jgi:hypothetical protein